MSRPRAVAAGGGTLALIASLAGNGLQAQQQHSEGERCQEVIMRQQETIERWMEVIVGRDGEPQ